MGYDSDGVCSQPVDDHTPYLPRDMEIVMQREPWNAQGKGGSE